MTRIAFTLLFHSAFPVLHLCSARHQAKQGGKHKAVLDGQDPGEVKTTWGNRIYKHSTGSWLLLANVSRWDVERKSGHVWHMPVVGTDPQLNCSRPKTHASRWDSCLPTLSVPCGVLRLQPLGNGTSYTQHFRSWDLDPLGRTHSLLLGPQEEPRLPPRLLLQLARLCSSLNTPTCFLCAYPEASSVSCSQEHLN